MTFPPFKRLALAATLMVLVAGQAAAQEHLAIAETLSERILFVTSGGYWEEVPDQAEAVDGSDDQDTDTAANEQGSEDTATDATSIAEAPALQRGYYRLIAIRGEDNRSRVELQQIALSAEGSQLAMSIGLEEINSLGAYVTDIRPENSTGRSSGPGFAAFIYLKTDPSVVEPETWALFVDEFGDILVEQSSN